MTRPFLDIYVDEASDCGQAYLGARGLTSSPLLLGTYIAGCLSGRAVGITEGMDKIVIPVGWSVFKISLCTALAGALGGWLIAITWGM